MVVKECSESAVRSLREAEEICARNGLRLTRLRRGILELLLSADGPVKAYDLIERMRDKGERLTPATIYRTLDFLLRYGMAHRINSLNAFVPCTGSHDEHALLMFVCSECRRVEELEDPVLYESMRARFDELGMSLRDNCIEIQGRCRKCSTGVPVEQRR
ncbi:MAG: transcriptional repressor [Desulfovibrio sp.]|jgi:Fur family zinc uptake transcriptional regulator|nr:transcriptional repressor [Desulfovibrio sp.]